MFRTELLYYKSHLSLLMKPLCFILLASLLLISGCSSSNFKVTQEELEEFCLMRVRTTKFHRSQMGAIAEAFVDDIFIKKLYNDCIKSSDSKEKILSDKIKYHNAKKEKIEKIKNMRNEVDANLDEMF